jgi:hypothetical protein
LVFERVWVEPEKMRLGVLFEHAVGRVENVLAAEN